MAKWISLHKAASKYGVDADDIRFWAEKKEIASACIRNTYIVDDESIQEFLNQHHTPPTREYIRTLRQLLENQITLCESSTELVAAQNLEMEKLERKVCLLEKVNRLLEEQNERVLAIARR